MNHFEVEKALKTMVVYCDSREQPTVRAKRRLEMIGLPVERKALPFGDYSAYCTLPNGEHYSLEDKVSIERKMNLGELAMCYTRERPRFIREFERSAALNATVYLVVENADWEKVYNGTYRSKMEPKAFSASIHAWPAKYGCHVYFCKEDTTGLLIRDILYREMKYHLEALPDEQYSADN